MDKYHSEKHVQAMYILQHIIYTTQVYKGKQKKNNHTLICYYNVHIMT